MSPKRKKKLKETEERERPVLAPARDGKSLLIKDPHLQFVFICFCVMAWLAFYSFMDGSITVGKNELRKSEVKQTLVRDAEEDTLLTAEKLAMTPVDKAVVTKRVVDTTGQRVLLFGDSELEGFMPALSDYCVENGHQLNSVVWYSSSTELWGNCDTLTYYIRKFKPTYVIACLGLNELFVREPQERKKYVRHIMDQCDSLKFIYVGPAFWKEDTGLDKMLMSTVGKGRYFQSKVLKMDRSHDGAHPTRAAARVWVDKVAEWIVNESKYPIKLTKPTEKHRTPPMVILRPSV
ncbi:MAG TPA: hypothetical protein VI112_15125 [Bacteroidia bacterium]|jgi:hypothetical protein